MLTKPKLAAIGALLAGATLIGGFAFGPAPAGEASPPHTVAHGVQPATSAIYYIRGGAVAFSTALGPTTSVPTQDALTFYLVAQTPEQIPYGSMSGTLTSTAQTCQSGKAKGTVFFGWPTGGGSTAHLRLTLSGDGSGGTVITITGKIVSGQFVGEHVSSQFGLATTNGITCDQPGTETPIVGGPLPATAQLTIG